jgi:hypothetical protein
MAAAEQKKSYAIIKQFKGIDTKANRTAIDKDEFYWLENAMPIGSGNLKITPAQSQTSNSSNSAVVFSNAVTYLTSANITDDYIVASESNGQMEYFDIVSKTKGNVAVAGTFSNSGVSAAQYENTNLFIGDPVNGLYNWNGTNLVNVGSVGSIGITNPGAGYTSAPSVTISAPNQTGGVQATAVASLSAAANNTVGYITLTNAGSGYTSPPTVTIKGGGATTNATAITQLTTFATGTVAVQINTGGFGYGPNGSFYVTFSGGGGSGANGTAIVSGNTVTQVIMNNPGSGYTSAPTVSFANGYTANVTANATATAVVNTNGIVDVATFSGRVWVAAGRTVYASSAVSPTDFSSVSAVAFPLPDSTLHGNIQALLSANNFLYVFGDDSINVFSNLQVTSSGYTVFTNTNISASIGTKRIYAIFPYFRSVLFMNDYGVYSLVGSTTAKISDPLDGIFPYIDFSKPVTAGQALINNILCAVFNFYVNSSCPFGYGGSRYIQAVFFEKKWFITNQGNNLKYVTSAPISGKINLYGTDTSNYLYQLYGDSTSNINSYIQTALQDMGDPIRTKQALKFAVEATLSSGGVLNATVDSETSSSSTVYLSNENGWINNSSALVSWTNNSSQVIYWTFANGYYLYKSDAQNYGKYLGLTLTSSSPAFVVNTFELEHELRVRF